MHVLSPIAHSHPRVEHGLPADGTFWQHYDREMRAGCDEVFVLTLGGWQASVGVQEEIRLAQERKAKAATDFRFICEQYFPLTFSLPWSQDHLEIIRKMERAVLHGGLFANSVLRGADWLVLGLAKRIKYSWLVPFCSLAAAAGHLCGAHRHHRLLSRPCDLACRAGRKGS